MNKTLIIGATSAIAAETAKLFAKRGDRLFLAARSLEKMEAVRKDLEVRGGKICGTFSLDLTDVSQHELLISKAINALDGVDTVLVAAQLITSLQTIISRNRNPQNPSVLSICSIQGGHTTNV
ncbi:SDR family NAD(P)-dependent oxidoreductase, partial [bacterium]|nr:SDR family NAD(P)-dependent oxidoreductase [bacterium]